MTLLALINFGADSLPKFPVFCRFDIAAHLSHISQWCVLYLRFWSWAPNQRRLHGAIAGGESAYKSGRFIPICAFPKCNCLIGAAWVSESRD